MEQTTFLKLTKANTGSEPGVFATNFSTNMEIIDDFASKQFFVFEQPTPSKDWVITHNLNRKPSVTVVDSADSVVGGDIEYIDNNSLILHFSGEFSGRAYLN